MSVTLDHPTHPTKKAHLKITPSTPLQTLLDQACQSWGLNSADYSLKLVQGVGGKKEVDVELGSTVRIVGVAGGSRLRVVPGVKRKAGPVTVALQPPDMPRMVAAFCASATTLWNVLQHFEGKWGVNLTRVTQTESRGMLKVSKEVYMMPACIVMNREFSTFESLKQTTLEMAGLSSGNGVIRVLLKATDMSLDAALTLLGSTPSWQAPVNDRSNAQTPPQSQTASAPSPQQTNTAPSLSGTSQSAPIGCPPSVVPTLASPNLPKTTHIPSESSAQSVAAAKDEESSAIANPASALPTLAGTATQDVEHEVITPFDREIRVFRPPPPGQAYPQFELPESFYDLSPLELRHMLGTSRARNTAEAPLLTRKMREDIQQRKWQKYPKTLVRVRLPGWELVQMRFLSAEQVQTFYDTLRSMLVDPTRQFTLYTTPPFKALDPTDTFWTAKLAPAALVYLKWEDDANGTHREGHPLKDEWRQRMEEMETSTQAESTGTAPMEGLLVGVRANEKDLSNIVPSMGHRLSDPSSSSFPGSSSRSDQDLHQSESQEGKSGGSEKKKPKWFKIGGK
ncbi:hypothetical protein DFS34DRAFT_193162 [Phlyctochytrium arcticum]|nr:hypothetical protein DFS34DRAFT_193162 [Phlyctochytrium arcticum]